MKLWEVLKSLEENPEDTYQSEDGFKVKTNGGYFEINEKIVASINRNYEKVKKSVTPAKAFEKWIEGHSVYYTDDSGYKQCIDDNVFKSGGCNVTKRSVKVYTWYVEDENE